jgi:hypothetical protein
MNAGMRLPKAIDLLHVPTGIIVDAAIVRLTDQLIRAQMGQTWWNDPAIDPADADREIDRQWNWTEAAIEWGGEVFPGLKLGVITGDGAVQGAALFSTVAVPLELEPGKDGLFLELLFIAPRNRHWIRLDRSEQFRGVGLQLLRAAGEFSRDAGQGGRLKLDASPDFVDWYAKRGFRPCRKDRIIHQGVAYTPMELTGDAVPDLLGQASKRVRGVRRGQKDH